VGLADRAGVPVETVQVDGEPAARVLAQARAWRADLVVLGRSDRPGVGEPYVGGHTRHVLEFAEQPVLVVPSAPGPRPAPGARGGH
ncbi:MAG TPA: universal stress protein, partial [Micromonosporaceae bacterium]|nr:universal stress protein [Micromonosporaceae bacterium]